MDALQLHAIIANSALQVPHDLIRSPATARSAAQPTVRQLGKHRLRHVHGAWWVSFYIGRGVKDAPPHECALLRQKYAPESLVRATEMKQIDRLKMSKNLYGMSVTEW